MGMIVEILIDSFSVLFLMHRVENQNMFKITNNCYHRQMKTGNPNQKNQAKLGETLRDMHNYHVEFKHPSKSIIPCFKSQQEELYLVQKKLYHGYRNLYQKIQQHSLAFQSVSKNIQNINDSYFSAITKIVEEQRIKMKAILQEETIKYQEKLCEHRRRVQEKINEFRTKRYISMEDEKIFQNLSKIQKPTFHIEKSRIEDILPLLQIIKPEYGTYVSFKKQGRYEEMETQPTDATNNVATIKKQQRDENKNKKPDMQKMSSFDFSCNEELTWEEKNKEGKKHEIISQIIFEEPSSCEDSLLSNQFS